MSFSVDPAGVPCLENYQQARAYYDNAEPWRYMDGPYDARPLSKTHRRKRHLSIRLSPNEDVRCTLHTTPVVIYHPDDTITVRSWQSISTSAVVNQLLPFGLSAWFSADPCVLWAHSGTHVWDDMRDGAARGYHVPNKITLRRTEPGARLRWEPVGEVSPFFLYAFDRTIANQALRAHNYFTFRDWLMMALRLARKTERTEQNSARVDCLAALSDRKRWVELLNVCLPYPEPSTARGYDLPNSILCAIRDAIYTKTSGVFTRTELPYVESDKELVTVKRGRKYRYLWKE